MTSACRRSTATSRLRSVDRRVSGADSWQNFYVMVGGAAAALTGLILVAVSLHLRAILGHPLYRDRAFTSLQGLVTILVWQLPR